MQIYSLLLCTCLKTIIFSGIRAWILYKSIHDPLRNLCVKFPYITASKQTVSAWLCCINRKNASVYSSISFIFSQNVRRIHACLRWFVKTETKVRYIIDFWNMYSHKYNVAGKKCQKSYLPWTSPLPDNYTFSPVSSVNKGPT